MRAEVLEFDFGPKSPAMWLSSDRSAEPAVQNHQFATRPGYLHFYCVLEAAGAGPEITQIAAAASLYSTLVLSPRASASCLKCTISGPSQVYGF